MFVRNEPEAMGIGPDGDPAPPPRPQARADGKARRGPVQHEGDFGVKDALRTPSFWQLAGAIGMRQFSKQVLLVHLIPLLVWKGFEEGAAAVLLGMFAFFQLPLRIGAARLADRWSMTRVSALSALGGIGGIVALLIPGDDWVINGLGFVFFFALAETGNSPGWAAIGDFFGRSRYATIRGYISLVQSAFSLPAPVVAGWVYDTTQSYYLALLPVGFSYLVSFVLWWTLRRPAQPPVPVTSGIVPAAHA